MSTLGILGGGQLAQMLATAAAPLGLHPLIYDAKPDACAFAGNQHMCASFDDDRQITAFAKRCNLVTCEFENIPTRVMELVGNHARVLPNPEVFRLASNRLAEKDCFRTLGIDVPAYMAVRAAAFGVPELEQLEQQVGFPLVVKTQSGGYDGKGQLHCSNPRQLNQWLAGHGTHCIAEAKINFDHELAMLVARNSQGQCVAYPPVAIFQHQGILHLATPCSDHRLGEAAKNQAIALARHIDYVGVLALEMFVTRDGRLLGNEFAPRVHNSGHWSIEGANCSQFTQHVRAICGMQLVQPQLRGKVVMHNIIGDAHAPRPTEGMAVYLYGKPRRAGRKVGHITLSQLADESNAAFLQRNRRLYAQLYNLPLPQRFGRLCALVDG